MLGQLDGFFVHNVLDGKFFEELADALVLRGRFDVVLLKGVLLRKLLGFDVWLELLVLLLPVRLLGHRILFMLLGVPDSVFIDDCGLWEVSLPALVHLPLGEGVDYAWQLD